MKNRGAVATIIVWSCVAFVFMAVLVVSIVKGANFSYFKTGQMHQVYTDSIDKTEFNNVEISWHAGTVTVRPSADDRMHLTQSSFYDINPLECTLSGDRLTIREKSDWGFFFVGVGLLSSNLELSLPQKQYGDFIMKMTSGTTDIDTVSASNMRLEMTSGRLNAGNLQADTFKANITSGDMTVDTATADSLSVNVTSGKANFNGEFKGVSGSTTSGSVYITTSVLPKTLDADLTSGKVSITIPDNDGFTLNYKKTSGSIHSDFDCDKNKNEYSYRSGGPDELRYTAKITSGSFELLKLK